MRTSRRSSVYVVLAFITIMIASGCNPAALYLDPDYEAKAPRSIAFFPLADSLMHDEATMDIMSWFEKRIRGRDYDIVKMASADSLLAKANVSRAIDTSANAIMRVCAAARTDAVMFFLMDPSESNYKVIFRTDELHVDLHLFSKDGQALWKQKIDESSAQFGLLSALNNKIDVWTDAYTRSLPNGKGVGAVR